MSIPLPLLTKQLESAQGFEFELILRSLRSDQYADQNLLKSDLSIFVSKVLKLLKDQNNDYYVWKACHLVNVLCTYNPVVLCSYAGMFLDAMFLKLEKLNYYKTIALPYGKELLKTLIVSLDTLMSLIRGKPALTRESLTPKLPAIINLLVTLSPNEPEICLPVLQKIILKNNNTFRPYVNKYHNVIKMLIVEKLNSFNLETQKLICDTYAYLHIFKLNYKNDNADKDASKQHQKLNPAYQWNQGIVNIISEFKPLLELMGQLLDFDEQILSTLKTLPSFEKEDQDSEVKKDECLKFPSLSLDLNEPLTLWEINQRLDTLCKLLQSFVSLPTPFQIRVPLFKIIKISEILLSLNTAYLPLQKGLRRDEEVTSVINASLPQLQFRGVVLFDMCISNFKAGCLPFSSVIFHSLQQFIPYYNNKSKKVNAQKCVELRNEFITVFSLISSFMKNYIGRPHADEVEIVTKFVDISLILLEKDSSLSTKFIKTVETKHQVSKQNKKQIKRQNALMGSLSDLYSHSYQFIKYSPSYMFDIVNEFLSNVLQTFKLPSTQQVKIINYAVAKSVQYKDSESFKHLLRTLVVYPGNERISILPIAATILQDDEYMKLLCTPKLPSNYIQQYNLKAVGSSNRGLDGDEDEEVENEEHEDIVSQEEESIDEVAMIVEDSTIPESVSVSKNSTEAIINTEVFSEDKILKRKVVELGEEEENTKNEDTKKLKIQESVDSEIEVTEQKQETLIEETPVVQETIILSVTQTEEKPESEKEEEEDSDFEMPEIDIS